MSPQPMITVSAAKVLQIAYVTAASRVDDPKLDILAGAVAALADRHPAMTQALYAQAIADIWNLLGTVELPAEHDLSGFGHRAIGRLFCRLVPTLGTGVAADALRDNARAHIAALRQGVDEIRKVSPMDSLNDQFGAGEQFRQDSWARLFAAATNSALRGAINSSVFFTRLGVRTTDQTTQILTVHPVEPLRGFYNANAKNDGSIEIPSLQIETLVDAAGAAGMTKSRELAENLFAINTAEETYLRATQTFAPPATKQNVPVPTRRVGTPKTALEQAIEQTQARQAELKKTLGDVKSGVSGALWLAGELAKLSNDPQFAQDITKFSKALTTLLESLVKYSESAINAAKKLVDLLDLGATGFQVIGAAIFTGGVVAAIFQIVSILGSSSRPDPLQEILRQLTRLRDLIQDVRSEMHGRFDRIDQRLNLIYDTMMDQFALVNWELGEISANVEELQQALYSMHSELNRLDRNMYDFFDTVQRVPLLEGITGYLNYFERLGVNMSFETFANAENLFYAWAHVHAKDSVQAGPTARLFDDDNLLTELGNYPLSTNINYLRELPGLKFALLALAPARLANPLTWGIAGEGYAQLGEEWPTHQSAISDARLSAVIADGQSVADGLDAVAGQPLFTALVTHYRNCWTALTAAIAMAAVEFQANPSNNLKGLGLWAAPTTMPTQDHYVRAARNIPACNGRKFGDKDNLPFEFNRWDHSGIAAFLNAGNLGLGTLSACIDGTWMLDRYQITGLGTASWYHLRVVVHVRYKPADAAAVPFDVFTHTFDTDKEGFKLIRPSDGNWHPNTAWGYNHDIDTIWSQIYTPAWDGSHEVEATAAQSTAVEAAVETKLDQLQRSFYGGVASKLRQAGDPLQRAGDRLTGSKRMWEAYITMGMPLTLEQDDHLRQLLFGGQALLVGADVGDRDGLLNDVSDIYRYFSLQDEPPTADILPDLIALGNTRANDLDQTMAAVITRIIDSGVPEGREIVLGTLTRLSLLAAQ